MLIWIGAAVTLLGLAGVLACIVMVWRARRAGLDEAALRARMRQVIALNTAALGVSGLGFMAVVTGILLG